VARLEKNAPVPVSSPVDGFSLAYERAGAGPSVVALHGWPGDRHDYRDVVTRLSAAADVVVPDLRGFGASDRHGRPAAEAYSAAAQARSVVGLLDELGLAPAVLAGYDVGGRVAQAVAAAAPERVRALVLSPPLPGIGSRILEPDAQREFWYQPFHGLPLADVLLDGEPRAVRAYLAHFWGHWSGPRWSLPTAELERLTRVYSAPGAFRASIAWYRAGAGSVARSLAERAPAAEDRLARPVTVLWGERDPLFPVAWADRLDQFFAAASLRVLTDVGHFVPLEAPEAVARAIRERL
jgi:pimeloyl-ACP methyl ester carboxylesterase